MFRSLKNQESIIWENRQGFLRLRQISLNAKTSPCGLKKHLEAKEYILQMHLTLYTEMKWIDLCMASTS